MQFSTVLVTLLPALVAAETLSSSKLCVGGFRAGCLPSSDGIQRCLKDPNVGDTCVVDCQSQSDCYVQCVAQGFKNGFCTIDGSGPCICSGIDGGADA
ncbi:Biotrophy-associated secreted protein 3 [Colletotrichum higginsianum IMI 349063]|uniref:Biotrophy-associated secreted protein 3 n=2 Tax=Colletotrichum higginsianum TaxID=80884 RepID=A0A1B7Y8G4_COLHI|nr:Biotrophy-associated secreted protein 3 [Colletotrichum higginsianum IMI 349063]OBR08294.1 Biotrophy-associated secreted protein 3 [Colletotrichum higginsianum IMI 349063]TIC95381.1 hypothetical protein CH35J_008979 [Colletotrichum higginsianum]